jgi:hypothetical protein
MHKLEDVKKYLKENGFGLSDERVEECYSLITNPEKRFNDLDKKWVACEQEHEKSTVKDVMDIVIVFSETYVKNAVAKTCKEFDDITHKPRIPFYVLVIDKLIP